MKFEDVKLIPPTPVELAELVNKLLAKVNESHVDGFLQGMDFALDMVGDPRLAALGVPLADRIKAIRDRRQGAADRLRQALAKTTPLLEVTIKDDMVFFSASVSGAGQQGGDP